VTGRGSRPGPAGWLRDLRRAASWHRRLLVAGLLSASVAFAIQAVDPAPPRTAAVVVAAKDLAAGSRLSPDDVRLFGLTPAALPDGALRTRTSAAGRTLVAPVRRGEVLTDVRLVSRSFLDSYGDTFVAAPVRIADPGAVRLVQPGDIVDVLAAGAGADGSATSMARLVAAAVPVVTVPQTGDSPLGATDVGQGALVVVVTSAATAARLAAAAVTDRLSLVIRGR
jgi:pilus assembly protein CpaB